MKINYTMGGVGLTGGVRVLFEIANRLEERGHEVTITTVGSEGDHDWFDLKADINYVDSQGVSRYPKAGANIGLRLTEGFSISPYYSIEKLAKATPECDINVATFYTTAFAVHRSDKGVPFYHMQHYEPLFEDDRYSQKMVEETYSLPINRIANSNWLQKQIEEKHGENLPVVNPAIRHNVFYPREVEKETDKIKVVSYAGGRRWKGFPEALEAMEKVMEERDDVEFYAYSRSKPDYNSDIDWTHVKGPSDEELSELYSSADIVISASWYESFPLPPIEAMACETAVVTTRKGTEEYAHDNVTAKVVPAKEPQEMADAILELVEDKELRQEIAENGRKEAQKYTWEKTVDKVEKIFEKKIEEK